MPGVRPSVEHCFKRHSATVELLDLPAVPRIKVSIWVYIYIACVYILCVLFPIPWQSGNVSLPISDCGHFVHFGVHADVYLPPPAAHRNTDRKKSKACLPGLAKACGGVQHNNSACEQCFKRHYKNFTQLGCTYCDERSFCNSPPPSHGGGSPGGGCGGVAPPSPSPPIVCDWQI